MALVLGKTCLRALRGHLRNPRISPVLYKTARHEHNIANDVVAAVSKEITDTSKEDMPVTLTENPFEREKEQCILCKYDITPNYKNYRLLSQFQSAFTGRVYPRNVTGLCKAKQAKVEAEIIKAQGVGFMGIYTKELIFTEDPRIFDPERPSRQHPY